MVILTQVFADVLWFVKSDFEAGYVSVKNNRQKSIPIGIFWQMKYTITRNISSCQLSVANRRVFLSMLPRTTVIRCISSLISV